MSTSHWIVLQIIIILASGGGGAWGWNQWGALIKAWFTKPPVVKQ